MAIKIKFDGSNTPIAPTLILANRNGKKLGQLKANSIVVKGSLNNAGEISFNVRKYLNGVKDSLWDNLVNFKLVWCKEWDCWFEITVEVDETNDTVKTVYCTRLGQTELSQIMLYNIEVNTETDISRDDYEITVLYNTNNPKGSLLDRLLEKAPHYSIKHVDAALMSIQRTFSFNSISIYDAFQEIAEELGCLFVFDSDSDENGSIQRTISVYDLQSNCNVCGYRGEFTGTCPECGGSDINEGYGKDTAIFVTSDELADEIQFSTDTGSVKNCFKLEGGDDLMTAAIRNCNPNGTDYIWYITDDVKTDMSEELTAKLNAYDELYGYYQNQYTVNISSSLLNQYNALVAKYQNAHKDLQKLPASITGYPALMTAYYNTIDFAVFLQSTLMPTVSLSATNASAQAKLLTRTNLSPVAVTDVSTLSSATANSAVLAVAKLLVDSRYRVKINTSALSGSTWSGNFTVTNYSDENDTATSASVSITINDDHKACVSQEIQKSLHRNNTEDISITGLFAKNDDDFRAELKKYCLNSLTSFHDICQSCIDILIEQGIGNKNTWDGSDPNLYKDLYVPYYDRLKSIQEEIAVRQGEIDLILGTYNNDGSISSHGVQSYIIEEKEHIQDALNFEKYLGNDLWLEFCAYRREDTYSNSSYISDGLNNAELFEKALEFIHVAGNEIYKSAELQHSITAALKNLLVIDKFKPLVDFFEVGNWLRIKIDDTIYKLRLIEYEIDYDNLTNLSVTFSDVMRIATGISDIESILSQASSMATSYDSVQRQASQGSKSNSVLEHWVEKGLDATAVRIMNNADHQTQSWDEHGMLFRKYNAIIDDYEDEQLKIINSTLAITNNAWENVKTAVGGFYYYHPVTGKLTYAYGVNGETIVGKLLLGEELGLYNENATLTFNKNGLTVENNNNSFAVNPNSDNLLVLSNKDNRILWVDANGVLHISGDGAGLDISLNSTVRDIQASVSVTNDKITSEISRATTAEKDLSDGLTAANSKITQTATDIETTVSATYETKSNASTNYSNLQSQITQNAENITLRVTANEVSSLIEQSAESIRLKASTIVWTANNSSMTKDGTFTCKSGTIAGWTITGSRIEKDNTASNGYRVGMQNSTSGSSAVFYAGCNTASGGNIAGSAYSNFYVTQAGYLYCNNADISGKITAKSGTIGGFSITSSSDTSSHVYANSLYRHSYDGTYYYEVGIKGDGNTSSTTTSTNLAFYVKRSSTNSWTTTENMFYVTHAGKLYCANADISGKITASTGAIAGWSITNTNINSYSSDNLHRVVLGCYNYDTTNHNAILVQSRTSTSSSFVSHFRVRYDGSVYADNVDISGKITATSGTIGGWKITSTKIYGGDTTTGVAAIQYPRDTITWVFAAGGNSHDNYANCPFRVSKSGALYTTNITATGGTIGGSSIDTSSIHFNNGTTGWGLLGTTQHANIAIYAGANTSNIGSAPFRVYHDGSVVANNLTATGGNIGGLEIGSNYIRKIISKNNHYITMTIDDEGFTSEFSDDNTYSRCILGYIDMKESTSYKPDYHNGLFFGSEDKQGYGGAIYCINEGDLTLAGKSIIQSTGTAITSDQNAKTDITPLTEQMLNIYDNITPVQYKLKDGTSGRTHTGFVAQELLEAIEHAGLTSTDMAAYVEIQDGDNSHCAIRYDELVALVAAATKRNLQKITVLEHELRELKEEIFTLKQETLH